MKDQQTSGMEDLIVRLQSGGLCNCVRAWPFNSAFVLCAIGWAGTFVSAGLAIVHLGRNCVLYE